MRKVAWAAVLLAGCAGVESDPTLEVAVQVSFLEGPTWTDDGSVYFSDIGTDRILKLSSDGKLAVFREKSGGANGNVIDPQGRLITCEGKARRVTRTDLKTGKVEIIAEDLEGRLLEGPNDVTIDGKGRIFFTDPGPPGQGRVFRIDPDGKASRILAGPDIEKPNGIAVSPDDRTLYLVESNWEQGGARMIRAYDLAADGSVSHMRVFVNFNLGRSMDGLSIDSQGNLYGAGGLNRVPKGTTVTLDTPAGIHVFAPDGTKIRFIPIFEDSVTNCCFGGPDLKTLYVTAGKTLYKVPVEVPGTRR